MKKQAFAKNIEVLGYNDLDGRPGFQMAMQIVDGRYYLYLAHFKHCGWTILDVTDPRDIKYLKWVPGPDKPGQVTLKIQVADVTKRLSDKHIELILQPEVLEALAKEVEAEHGGRQGGAEAAVDAAITAFRSAFGAVADKIHHISSQADSNLATCGNVLNAVKILDKDVETASDTLESSRSRAHALLGLSENLIEITTRCGVETEDSPYIDAVVQAAEEIGQLFEDAVDGGQISLTDLFDERYEPIAGSNPQQHSTRYLRFVDQVLPPTQEAMLQFSPSVVFCAAVDRNGYLPTHNLKFSKPQGRNPEWNAANCRNRRIFDDRTGLAAGRNEKPFLLQTYRRDMGGGKHVLMKDLSAPIFVKGRHWGGLRMAYLFE